MIIDAGPMKIVCHGAGLILVLRAEQSYAYVVHASQSKGAIHVPAGFA